MIKDRYTQNLMYTDLYPRVARSGVETEFTLKAMGGTIAFDADRYRLIFCPMEAPARPLSEYPSLTVEPSGGALRFRYAFTGEMCHQIHVYREGDDQRILTRHVYALLPDLFERRPYRGDLHVHTHYSDGLESPAVVAAHYRMSGFDFLAITDHEKYAPSLEAIERISPHLPMPWLFPGEEVHAKGTPIHMVHIGGSYSVNERIQNHREEVDRQIAQIEAELPGPLPENRYLAAAFHWCRREINRAGGLAIYPHPYWIANVYHIDTPMVDYLFASRAFDAYELLGGQTPEENNMQTAHYVDACVRLGHTFPVVGSSDSHGTVGVDGFRQIQTIAFTRGKDGLLDDIREGFSVAVDARYLEQPRVYGPFRLVKYALFLLQEYFPMHDLRCVEEGRALRELACGEPAPELPSLAGRTEAFLKRFFGE